MKAAVARADEIAPAQILGLEVDDTRICLVRVEEGAFYATSDNCTHQDCPLSEGELEDFAVECPCHGSRFDVRSGDVLNLPAILPVATYPVEIVNGDVVVNIPD
jgi:3-phenylpropionate/trans-cinnamate dioxygenase ferredoxin component